MGYINGEIQPGDYEEKVYAADHPEDILIVKAGGNSGIYSELIMNYYGLVATTAKINDPQA